MFVKDLSGCFGHCCIEGGDHWQLKKRKNSRAEVFASCLWGPWICILSFVSWTGRRCGDQRLGPVQCGILCVRQSKMASALSNDDKIGHGGLWVINWMPRFTPRRLLSRERHVIIMWLFGLIKARLTLCNYPQVSLSSSSMLIAATGRCLWLLIWIREFATLKQPIAAQLAILPPPNLCPDISHRYWRTFTQRSSSPDDWNFMHASLCGILSWYSAPFRAFWEVGVRPGGCYRNCLRYWPIIIWMKMCSAFFLFFFFFFLPEVEMILFSLLPS